MQGLGVSKRPELIAGVLNAAIVANCPNRPVVGTGADGAGKQALVQILSKPPSSLTKSPCRCARRRNSAQR
jgi:hypothetical protein